MVISKGGEHIETNINVNGQVLEQVENYKYFGSIVTRDARYVDEIKTCITIAKNAFNKAKHFVISSSIAINIRKHFIKSCVWSTLMYGCKDWTNNKNVVE